MDGRYLLGSTPVDQARAALRHEFDLEVAPEDLAERTARAEGRRAGRLGPADLPGAEPVPEAWRGHLGEVAGRPLFRRLFADRRWRFAAVPVRSLISVQAHLHYAHARRKAEGAVGPADLLELCLPVRPEPVECWGGIAHGDPPSASFFTRDPNVRIVSARLETEPLRLTFTIGSTAAFLQVVRLHGRLYLTNGTHRAVGLAARGVEWLPCVLVDGADVDDLPRQLPYRTLMASRPPLAADFLDPELYLPHPWGDRVKFIRLAPEMFSAPVPAGHDP